MAAGQQRYQSVNVPILAIFAFPRELEPPASDDGSAQGSFQRMQTLRLKQRVDAFEAGLPSARVVRLPQATHYLFLSSELEVLRELEVFIASLR
jgi:hypothetical protein